MFLESSPSEKVVILGPHDRLKTATIKVDVLINSIKQIAQMEEKQRTSKKKDDEVVKEVWIDPAVVGLVIGAGG